MINPKKEMRETLETFDLERADEPIFVSKALSKAVGRLHALFIRWAKEDLLSKLYTLRANIPSFKGNTARKQAKELIDYLEQK